MFKDEQRRTVWDTIRQHDIRAFSAHLTADLVGEAVRRAGVRFGAGPLNVFNLTWLALSSALHWSENFTNTLSLTFKLLEDYEAVGSQARKPAKPRRWPRGHKRRCRHDPRRDDLTVVSEEAFTKARRLLPMKFWTELILLLVARIEHKHLQRLCWKGFRLLALDGTVIGLPHWKRLRKHFGAATNGRRACRTQVRLVMLQFPLARLPYCYALSPLSTNEIPLAMSLLDQVRRNDLILMDRGFFSYGMFWAIQQQNAFFAIRLKAGVRLETVRRVERDDHLVRWKPCDRRKKWRDLPESIELRVISYQVPGFRPSAVVTNATNPQRTSREDWVRLTTDCEAGHKLQAGLYHRRWEIETTFRELKVAQGLKRGLRSRTPEGIAYEIAGHVLLYFLVRWLILETAVQHERDPLRISFVEALRELNVMRPALLIASPTWAQASLTRLMDRIASHLVPLRPGRSYPRPNDGKTKNKGKGRKQLAAKVPA
jgi:hypothetical protein